MSYRPKLVAATVVAVAGLAAAGCSSGSSSSSAPSSAAPAPGAPAGPGSAADLSAVTLNVGDQKGTGAEAVLQAAGLLKTLPFKVNWSDFTSGPTMVQAMSTGAVDIGGVGDAPPVFAASGGENIEIVGARETPGGDADAIVVPKNSPIHSIAQLKGKKIAVSFGSSDDYELLTVLTKNGLTTKDVTLVNLQPAPGLAAFTSGAIDAWDIWPPYVQQLQGQYGGRVIATGKPYGSPYSFEVASKSAVGNPAKAAAIKVYLATLDKAYRWTDTHQSAWAAVWGQATGLPASIMEQAAKVEINVPAHISNAVVSSEQGLVAQFYAAGLIPGKVDMSKFITSAFNDTVSGG
ncbi:MAG TPA: ABC transporter substrate-binding protein [Trebonia sp.]|jgi:sulfonate transport system substrate-binding protein|nr:ABC transporter substrate-binding protein [Trebonia sp.]